MDVTQIQVVEEIVDVLEVKQVGVPEQILEAKSEKFHLAEQEKSAETDPIAQHHRWALRNPEGAEDS